MMKDDEPNQVFPALPLCVTLFYIWQCIGLHWSVVEQRCVVSSTWVTSTGGQFWTFPRVARVGALGAQKFVSRNPG